VKSLKQQCVVEEANSKKLVNNIEKKHVSPIQNKIIGKLKIPEKCEEKNQFLCSMSKKDNSGKTICIWDNEKCHVRKDIEEIIRKRNMCKQANNDPWLCGKKERKENCIYVGNECKLKQDNKKSPSIAIPAAGGGWQIGGYKY
jgi:hypothetical protein